MNPEYEFQNELLSAERNNIREKYEKKRDEIHHTYINTRGKKREVWWQRWQIAVGEIVMEWKSISEKERTIYIIHIKIESTKISSLARSQQQRNDDDEIEKLVCIDVFRIHSNGITTTTTTKNDYVYGAHIDTVSKQKSNVNA